MTRQPDEYREVSVQQALDLAYRYLGHRDRTVAEVRKHLEAKGAEAQSVEVAIEELQEQGYLDDARLARRFTEDRRNLDAWGDERIERRLRSLGVASELITAALGSGDHDELSAAVELLERRYRGPLRGDRDRQRALALLARRGYELELAYDAVRAHTAARSTTALNG